MSGFLDNQQYVITVSGDVASAGGVQLGTDQQFSFVSTLDPYIGNPLFVYNTVMGFIPGITDIDICTELFLQTHRLWSVAASLVDPILSGSSVSFQGDVICYINNSVIANLLRRGFIATMGGGITLGDLSVKEPNYNNIAPLIRDYELAAEICWMNLNLGRKIQTVIKGENRVLSPGVGARRSWSHDDYPDQRKYPGYRNSNKWR